MLEFATDVHPANSTALIQDAEQARMKFEKLEAKWDALREPMGVLIIGLPTAAERDLAEDVLERFSPDLQRDVVGSCRHRSRKERGNNGARSHKRLGRSEQKKLRTLREAVHGAVTQLVSLDLIDSTAQVFGTSEEEA